MKRLVSLLLLLAMLLSLATATAFAKDEDLVRLRVISRNNTNGGLFKDTYWTDYWAEKLGIELELIPFSEGKIEALMAADDLPDIVFESDDAARVKALVESGQLIALSDHQDALPNYYARRQLFIKYATTAYDNNGDGKLYVLPRETGMSLNGSDMPNIGKIRFDLYAKLGYPEINDPWEFLDLIKQMVELYPANSAGQKTFGFSMFPSWDDYYPHNVQALPVFGNSEFDRHGSAPYSLINRETLEISNILDKDSKFIESLRFAFAANQMGIMDPDSMTQSWESWNEKSQAGRILYLYWQWCGGGNEVDGKDARNADDPTGYTLFVNNGSKTRILPDALLGPPAGFGIGHNTKHLDKALAYLDTLCNPDELFFLVNGPQGEMWDLDENGKPYLIEEFRNRPSEERVFSSGGSPGDGLYKMSIYPFSPNNYSEKYQSMVDSGLWDNTIAAQEVSKLDQLWADHYGYDRYNRIVFREWLDKNGYGVEYPLAENLLAPPSDDMLFTAKAIADIVVPSCWQAIFAGSEEEFNQIVDSMISDANALGLEDLLADNAARWQEAKAWAETFND
jgi:putative aldouronate transport system substrate-binding protein